MQFIKKFWWWGGWGVGIWYRETPSGDIDWINTQFYLAHTPASSEWIFVYLNGVVRNDFIYDLWTNSIILDFAPTIGSVITVQYFSSTTPATVTYWWAIEWTLSSQTDLQAELDNRVIKNTDIIWDTKTKITYDNKWLVTAWTDATTADIAASTNKNYVTDAQVVVIWNTSWSNSWDNAANSNSWLVHTTGTETVAWLKTFTNDVTVWKSNWTAGNNITTYATLWVELVAVPPLTTSVFTRGNWTLTSWRDSTNSSDTALNKNAAGVTTATLNTVAAEVGKTYKIVFTCWAASWWSFNIAFGWRSFVTTSAAWTYTSYITASSVTWLVVTPNASATAFTITAISLKEVTNATWSVYCENDLYLWWDLLKPDWTQIAYIDWRWTLYFTQNINWLSWLSIWWAISWATTIASSGVNTNTQLALWARETFESFISTNTTAWTAAIPVSNSTRSRWSWTAWNGSVSNTTNWVQQLLNRAWATIKSRFRRAYDLNGWWYWEIMNITNEWELNILWITLWTESLTNWALTSWTSRTRSGDFALTGNAATYTHSGWSWYIQQASASLAVPLVWSRRYSFTYTISGWTWTAPYFYIDTITATNQIVMPTQNWTYTIYFKTIASPTDFRISWTSATTWAVTIDTLSLKEVSWGTVFSDRVECQFLKKKVGADVASWTTITPTWSIFKVTWTTTIQTINVPYTWRTGQITIIPTWLFLTWTAWNIALATTAVVSKVIIMTYNGTSRYPNY